MGTGIHLKRNYVCLCVRCDSGDWFRNNEKTSDERGIDNSACIVFSVWWLFLCKTQGKYTFDSIVSDNFFSFSFAFHSLCHCCYLIRIRCHHSKCVNKKLFEKNNRTRAAPPNITFKINAFPVVCSSSSSCARVVVDGKVVYNWIEKRNFIPTDCCTLLSQGVICVHVSLFSFWIFDVMNFSHNFNVFICKW